MSSASNIAPPINDVKVSAYKIPTDKPESDGTLKWTSTILVLVEGQAGEESGFGYTYAAKSTAQFIQNILRSEVTQISCFDIPAAWQAMKSAIRNQGTCGMAFMALSAVDTALWDLKAKLLGLPLIKLIGAEREGMPVYGSGGFTSYSIEELEKQLVRWVDEGIPRVKMKIGRHPGKDLQRVQAVRESIGPDAELFVDANGAYSVKQAGALAKQFADEGVSWFEEPVLSDDLDGLRFIRQHRPAGMEVAAGEYGYRLSYFNDMLAAGAVDVLQADATRCGGITGFLRAGTVCDGWH